jgi:hypothetical protein
MCYDGAMLGRKSVQETQYEMILSYLPNRVMYRGSLTQIIIVDGGGFDFAMYDNTDTQLGPTCLAR